MTSPFTRLFILLALVGALVVVPMLSAAECVICVTGRTTSAGGGAASHWGHGTSCAAAQQDLRNKLFAAADQACEAELSLACNVQVVYTAPCWQSGVNTYTSDGYANYGCYEEDPACYD